MHSSTLTNYLKQCSYPGRGIFVYRLQVDEILCAYWIMGRSKNSRNRIFEPFEDGNIRGVRTVAANEKDVEDPHLIIYNPYIEFKDKNLVIITNGDQTDTIFSYLKNNNNCMHDNFLNALMSRDAEDDEPNFTPRISCLIDIESFSTIMSIIKKDCDSNNTNRNFFIYDSIPLHTGRFISTYKNDDNPLPPFSGEPQLKNDIFENLDDFTNNLWETLNFENKISLLTISIKKTGEIEHKIINKYKKIYS